MDTTLARAQLQRIYSAHTNPYFTAQALDSFELVAEYFGTERAYHEIIAHLYSRAALADYAETRFTAEQRWTPGQTLEDYNASLPADLVIGLLFPQATPSATNSLNTWLEAGWLSNHDLLYLRVAQPTLPPNPTDLAQLLLDHPDIPFQDWLQLPDLGLSALAPQDVSWLLGLYVAAFARAPEPAGLAYWAQQLLEARQAGGDPQETLQTLAGHIDWAGSHKQEAGTLLLPADYVAHVYRQGLGREADAEGLVYWAEALANGDVPRGHFLAVFLHSAQQSPGDADYLQARVAVAGHAAHALLQNPDAPIDLAGLLQSVHDPASALAALATLPVPPAGLPSLSSISAAVAEVSPPTLTPDDLESALPWPWAQTATDLADWLEPATAADPTLPFGGKDIDASSQPPWQPPFPQLNDDGW